MQSVVQRYRIYKDRFLLACTLSVLVHIIVFFIYYQLPMPEKKAVLRPIALGVLQPQKLQKIEQNNTESQEQGDQQPITTPNKIPAKQEKASIQTTPQPNTSIAPNIDVDLQSLNIPQEQGKFDPFAKQQPSLTENLKMQADNVSFDKLPQRVHNDLLQLYGTELQNMTKEEKDYLAESYFLNGEVFQQTADRMGYPKLAAYLKQQGVGLIEFILYPDGHVDNIKILQSTKSETLDDSMRQTIEQSAKNLKRPPKPIRIRLRGHYNLQAY